jgi:hypothetical protein
MTTFVQSSQIEALVKDKFAPLAPFSWEWIDDGEGVLVTKDGLNCAVTFIYITHDRLAEHIRKAADEFADFLKERGALP